MDIEICNLISRLENKDLQKTSIISWGSPVPAFGDVSVSIVATLGLNPSNLEFVDQEGNELDGVERRFHTLSSLGLSDWNEADEKHAEYILELCKQYFYRNPYNRWFKRLDYIISGTSYSYYFPSGKACHLDLVPYATSTKWGELARDQQLLLLEMVGDTLGLLLRKSPVKILILNGKTVVNNFIEISNAKLEVQRMPEWTLPRKDNEGVAGYGYLGEVSIIGGVKLKRKVKVLGYNHNIQSSFGVTKSVQASIRNWVSSHANKYLV